MERLEKRVENIPSENGVGVRVYGNQKNDASPHLKTLKFHTGIWRAQEQQFLTCAVCDRHSFFGCSRNDHILKDVVFAKFLDIMSRLL